ncbi:MAG: response regulator [Propionibacteriaceae bacterium]
MLPRKVLVVDDDDIIREVAKLALEVVGGWQVSTATNGQEAGRLASSDRPDVVLLDVMMPALDGPGTAALLREDPLTREVPVIFLTAKTPLGEEQLASEPNVVGVISKPFDPMVLAQEINRLTGWDE